MFYYSRGLLMEVNMTFIRKFYIEYSEKFVVILKKNNRSSLLSLENNYRHANGGAKLLTIRTLKSVYKDTWPMGFFKLYSWNSIKNSGLVAPVSRSEFDDGLDYFQCVMHYGSYLYGWWRWMKVRWVISIKRDRTAESVRILKETAGVHELPNWSVF